MPAKSLKRKYPYGRKYQGAYKRFQALVPVRRQLNIKSCQPQKKMVKLVYCDNIELSAGTTVPAIYTFRLNSIYDPDHSGTGHQPMGHDQWATFYDHYSVLSCKITMVWTTTDYTYAVVAFPHDIASPAGTYYTDFAENSDAKIDVMTPDDGPHYMTYYWSAKKYFGVPSSSIIGDSKYSALFHANPSEQAYYTIGALSKTTAGTAYCTVKIEYVCMLTEPKTLTQS